MKKKALFIPSVNGFGHLRRCMAIASSLTARNFDCSIMWNHSIQVPTWAFQFCRNRKINLIMRETPLNYEGPNFRNKDSTGSLFLKKEIESYDLLFADTVTWPLEMNDEVVFFAQFCWELYYSKMWNENFNIFEKVKKIANNVKVFGMEMFVWEEMKDFTNFQSIPVLDYWNLRGNVYTQNQEILVSRSGARSEKFADAPNWIRKLKNLNGMENYLHSQNSRPLGVLCRAGVGILSECISSKVLPIFKVSDDYEMTRNIKKCFDNEVGLSIDTTLRLNIDEVRNLLRQKTQNTVWPQVITPDRFIDIYLHEYL